MDSNDTPEVIVEEIIIIQDDENTDSVQADLIPIPLVGSSSTPTSLSHPSGTPGAPPVPHRSIQYDLTTPTATTVDQITVSFFHILPYNLVTGQPNPPTAVCTLNLNPVPAVNGGTDPTQNNYTVTAHGSSGLSFTIQLVLADKTDHGSILAIAQVGQLINGQGIAGIGIGVLHKK